MTYSTRNVTELQQTLAPAVYGGLDLGITPERFRTALGENSILRRKPRVQALLDDAEQVEFFRQLTLMGDPLTDAFAARIPELGYPKARAMVDQAAAHGIDSVPDAPPELVALLRAMEAVPAWVDWDAIERASEHARLFSALGGEALTRVAFMMTYVNGYQGLPMVITGALTSDSAAKRMKETTSTFKLATLPGALRRGGEAYQSAVKVRVMHAMVRTSLLRRPTVWDFGVYGTPIPQVDQMGAALTINYRLAQRALARGRGFSTAERGVVEQGRYLASLLGMHDQFLSDDPQQIVETWQMCQATLRHKFDERGRDLNRATLEAYRRTSAQWHDRVLHGMDQGATRFLYTQLVGEKTAHDMGVQRELADALAFASVFAPVGLGFGALTLAKRAPGVRRAVDRFATRTVKRQLRVDGAAEYRTNEANYKTKAA
ncbi:MAG: oxygenase MpaB family protein [Polyangiales bacterium]|nr:DUF2236 domain-containing protein [Sandaracinaceae bacterium]